MKRDETGQRLLILVPVYNDWESAKLLLQALDANLHDQPFQPQLLFLDDSSSKPVPSDLVSGGLKNVACVESVRLRRNLGHQRAIAIGLSFAYSDRPCNAVLIMDADGEDKPEDVPRLI